MMLMSLVSLQLSAELYRMTRVAEAHNERRSCIVRLASYKPRD